MNARGSSRSRQIHRIDDADDGGIHRRGRLADRLAGRTSFEHDQHPLVDARADAVDREQFRPAGRVFERQRLHQKQLRPFQLPVLLRRDERADHACEDHAVQAYPMCQWSTMPDDAGVGRHLNGVKRKAGFLAADEEDLFSDASANRIGRDDDPPNRFAREDDSGCTSSNVTPSSVSFLLLSTTVPMTLPSCI